MHRHPALGADWLSQIFRAKAVVTGGVVRRRVRDVEREIGRDALELEVRKRGFHMIECGDHFVILCTRDPVQIIC
ncbi:N-(5'-phosphoribosyl)anthranilate isomerase [uncultured Aliiroseovarius sp.]|nr:N-(5'-phosphoribosyl)anthranilate isomerase [uncultured Aliiroseovarius sp.]MCI2398290.1 N-(5'-phosphoribosyl)anthranilate isomerase [Aliiroseovarius subalbicans]